MKPHIIDEDSMDALKDFYLSHETTMASSRTMDGERKEMTGDLKGNLRVRLNHEVKYNGPSLLEAVDAYNELY